MIRMTSVLGALALCMLLVVVAHAQASDVPTDISGSIKVDGLSCPFCAYGMEKKLSGLGWAEDIKIHIDAGRADFDVKAGQVPDVNALRKAVIDGGYTPRSIHFTIQGAVERSGDAIFVLLDSGHRVELAHNDTRKAMLKAFGEGEGKVRVEGLPESSGMLTKIAIITYKIL